MREALTFVVIAAGTLAACSPEAASTQTKQETVNVASQQVSKTDFKLLCDGMRMSQPRAGEMADQAGPTQNVYKINTVAKTLETNGEKASCNERCTFTADDNTIQSTALNINWLDKQAGNVTNSTHIVTFSRKDGAVTDRFTFEVRARYKLLEKVTSSFTGKCKVVPADFVVKNKF